MKQLLLLQILCAMSQLSLAQYFNTHFFERTDTAKINFLPKRTASLNQVYTPVSLIIFGLSANGKGEESLKHEFAEERNEHLANFRTHIDDYLQYSPIILGYGLDAFGVKSRNDIKNRTAILLKGELGMAIVTTALKHATSMQRPDFSNNHSFPSGHTAQAFAAATFLSEEYKHKLKWIPYVSYTIASVVGGLRMANNKHYVSDVLVGAGIGIFSVKIAYWTHKYKWGKNYKTPLR